ncbi:MAG TPA: serine/threonine-protein kinase, partial [Pseudonocardiaceae bacterium]|nr:serine/threonine-protein kinase [Pseudonocardiaceae bacterium]
MGAITTLVGELLSLLHGLAGLPVCPGNWVWTITAAGVLLAVPPVLAASFIAVVRRFIGNRYRVGTVLLFAVLGVLGFAVLPMLGFVGAATAIQRAALGTGASGLSGRDVADLQDAYCFLPAQSSYLGGGGRTVSGALTALPGPDWLLGGRTMVMLVALPVFALLLTYVLARLAVRRGPSWPGWLLVLPFLILVVGTLPLDEGVVSQLWAGYTAGVVPGLFLLLVIGRPRWSVIRRSQAAVPASPQPPTGPQAPPEQQPAMPARQPPRTLALPESDDRPAPSGGPAPPHGPAPLAPAPGPLPQTLAAGMAGAAAGADTTQRAAARFRRLRQLGEGGFGDVWLAVDTVLGREVAIKVARAPDADTEQRIRREARSLAAVDHPHCVRVYDILSGLDDLPGLAIIMEYLPGPSLAQQVRSFGPLSDTAGAHLWSTLAGALDAAHRRGVLHRDVKPS